LGILIALQIDNWNENRKDKIEEKIILKELQSNLELVLFRINRNIENLEQNLKSFSMLKNHTDRNLPFHDSLNADSPLGIFAL